MAQKNNKYSGRKLKKPNMKQEGNFTQIPNAFLLNPDIGKAEIRVLSFIMIYSGNRIIKTEICSKYLKKTPQAIYTSFEKLIELGILEITDETIEVIIPEEMKKYKLGYLDREEKTPNEVKKTLPNELEKNHQEGQEYLTSEVKKTLLAGQENLTPEVKKTYKKPLECIDNDNDTSPIILNNTRVLPVPATSGNTEQSHSNDNTKGNTGIELDLECDELQSQASPSVLAPSLHTPKQNDENSDKESSLPIAEEQTYPTVEEEQLPIEPDARFAEQLEVYNTSKYFLPEKLDKVKDLYNNYANLYPNEYLPIKEFEKVLIYQMTLTVGGIVERKGINYSLMYRNEICLHLKDIPQSRQEMVDYPIPAEKLLKTFELN